jgi:hypothetical protein
MRERVLAIGGRFDAGPWPGGAFRVTAALPYRPLALTGDSVTRETVTLETLARETLAREGRR